MSWTKSIAFAALLIAPTGLWADGHAGDTLAIYAAMSKLEANKAEAAGAVMLAAIPDLPEEVRAEAAEDYAGDLAQIDAYIEALRGMNLTDAQAGSVDAFATQWGTVSAEGTALIGAPEDTAEYHQRVFAWWERLDGLADLLDAALEVILDENGIELAD